MNADRQNIDDLFREGLADCNFAPSTKVWGKISKRLSWYEFISLNFTNFLHNSYLIGTAGLTASALITGTLLLTQVDPPTDLSTVTPQPKEVAVVNESSHEVGNSVAHSMVTPQLNVADQPIIVDKKERNSQEQIIALQPAEPSSLEKRSSQTAISLLNSHEAKLNVETLIADLDLREVLALPSKTVKDSCTDPILFRLGFNMGYMQRSLPLTGGDVTSKNPFGGLVARVESGRWYAETGISLHEEEDHGYYKAFYRTFDSVGFYEKVESYIPDPTKPDEVILITRRLAIWDSVDRYGEAQTLMNYRYLNVPFKLGYRFLSGKWYNLSAYGAGVMSLQTATQKTDPVFSSRFYRILVLEDHTLERRSLLWSLQAGLRFDVALSKRIYWEFEPWYRVYTKSAYLSPLSKSGQAWGLNTGFSVKF